MDVRVRKRLLADNALPLLAEKVKHMDDTIFTNKTQKELDDLRDRLFIAAKLVRYWRSHSAVTTTMSI